MCFSLEIRLFFTVKLLIVFLGQGVSTHKREINICIFEYLRKKRLMTKYKWQNFTNANGMEINLTFVSSFLSLPKSTKGKTT